MTALSTIETRRNQPVPVETLKFRDLIGTPGITGRLFLALAGGAVVPFAFAPYDLYPLAVVSLAVLFYLWIGAEPKAAAIIGFVFGLGMFGHGVWWIQVSVHQFGLPVYAFSVAVTAAFIVFMALYPALCGYLAAMLPATQRSVRILCLYPVLWTAIELLRGWLFSGFPWLLIGYSQTDSPLSVFAPLIGAYGISLIVCLIAAAMIVLWQGERVWRGIAAGVLAGVVLAVSLLDDVRWTVVANEAQGVALIQGAVPQAVKWRRSYRQPSIDLYAELSQPYWGRSILIWPETAIPAFAQEVPESIAMLDARAAQSGSTLLIGMPTGSVSGNGKYFNSVVQFGSHAGRYDKRQLVPFGEYLPFDRWIRPLTSFLKIPMSNFSAGKPVQPLLAADNYTIGVSICYEDAYAGEVARALPEANVLVNVSNDAWFGDSIAPHQHLQIARMRALEAGRYLLRATNTGISAIIDERGRVVAQSPQFVAAVVQGEFIPLEGSTPIVTYGAAAPLSVCMLVLLLVVVAGRRARPIG